MAIWSVGEVKSFEGTLSEAVGAPVGNGLRRPLAHCAAILIGERGHPGQLVVIVSTSSGSNRLPVVPSGSGTSVGAQPARDETRSGRPLAAASLTTSPQGSERLGSTNAPA